MRTRLLGISLLTLAMLTVGCGRLMEAASPGIDHPTGSDDLILRMDVGGGFVAPATSVGRIPSWSLFGDGRIITEGPQIEIYPGPALPSVQVQLITEDGIQAILEAARDAGLLGPDRTYRGGCTSDAPTTTFTLYAEGAKHVVTAYALGASGTCPGGSNDQAPPRLAAFAAKLTDLAGWLPKGSLGDQGPFDFSQTRVFVQPYSASPDQGLEEPVIAWPLSPGLAAFGSPHPAFPDYRCGVVGGSDLSTLLPELKRANQLTPWGSDGARFLLTLRPLLPDEHTC